MWDSRLRFLHGHPDHELRLWPISYIQRTRRQSIDVRGSRLWI